MSWIKTDGPVMLAIVVTGLVIAFACWLVR